MPAVRTTRRQILQIAGALPLLGGASRPQFAYRLSESSVDVFTLSDRHWKRLQSVASRNPAFLVRHPSEKALYVANQITEHEGLPSGTIEAFQIDRNSGLLTLLSRTPLSLSATGPRHLALAPEGDHLIAAAFDGGILNVLPIDRDGGLSNCIQILKEIGCSQDPRHQAASHPHTCVFDPAGHHLVVSDLGADRLTVFAWGSGKLTRHFRLSVKSGDGPGPIEFDPSRAILSVTNLLSKSMAWYPYDPRTGEIGPELSRRRLESARGYTRNSRQTIAARPGHWLPVERDLA